MPRPKKGERPAGRSKGTPNRVTVEAAEIARISNEQAKARGVKLGKEMLEDYMMAFHNVAATYQNRIAQALQAQQAGLNGSGPAQADIDAFKDWGGLVVSTAKELAKYQSPTFRAIAVVAPPPGSEKSAPVISADNVITIKDAQALSRVYQNMVRQVKG